MTATIEELAHTIWRAGGDRQADDGALPPLRECLKPVIARVDGYAVAAATTWPTSPTSRSPRTPSVFGQNGPRVASPAEGWLVSHLWTVVGMKRAKEIWMLYRRYTAHRS
ncbi:enoyl-CoA hydratase-related protein [Pseudonocardia alni]|jgi:1,4-dihydroxy-2-naphthoyl-CoA synthase|uniref:enoyl-CoA hydratase-related protein n=1 Tax=Pseudonocardia alni TaxID=33907 RepID=UPI0036ABD4B5